MRRRVLLVLAIVALSATPADAVTSGRHVAGIGERTILVYNDLPAGQWQAELARVLGKWSASSYIAFVDAGTRNYHNCSTGFSWDDHEVDLCFGAYLNPDTGRPYSWLAQAYVWSIDGVHISSAQIEINGLKSFGPAKMRWVLAHELGHTLGLEHPSTCVHSVMVATFSCAVSQALYLPSWADFQDIRTMYAHDDTEVR